jgi:hypothetical protein
MPGNQPADYGNTAFLWGEPEIVPYGTPPLAAQPIPTNLENGVVDLGNLQLQERTYTVGYAVGPEVKNTCSWVSIAIDGTTSTFQTSVQVVYVAQQMVAVQYETPAGNQPPVYGQWIGLWEGPSASHTIPPVASVQIAGNFSRGTIELEALIIVGSTYSVGYFMGQKQTTLAASCTFTA